MNERFGGRELWAYHLHNPGDKTIVIRYKGEDIMFPPSGSMLSFRFYALEEDFARPPVDAEGIPLTFLDGIIQFREGTPLLSEQAVNDGEFTSDDLDEIMLGGIVGPGGKPVMIEKKFREQYTPDQIRARLLTGRNAAEDIVLVQKTGIPLFRGEYTLLHCFYRAGPDYESTCELGEKVAYLLDLRDDLLFYFISLPKEFAIKRLDVLAELVKDYKEVLKSLEPIDVSDI